MTTDNRVHRETHMRRCFAHLSRISGAYFGVMTRFPRIFRASFGVITYLRRILVAARAYAAHIWRMSVVARASSAHLFGFRRISRACAAHVGDRRRMCGAYEFQCPSFLLLQLINTEHDDPSALLQRQSRSFGQTIREQYVMVDSNTLDHPTTKSIDTSIVPGITFLSALFSESDTVLFRPIEAWEEKGKKRSRVDYRNSRYGAAQPESLSTLLRHQLLMAEREHTNLFFGVCPRFGIMAKYDLAWQIRTVRSLWADVDHIVADEALSRVSKAGLPAPSIVINSGNGVHLYWLLDEPYEIDDVGEPLAVLSEWTEKHGKKKCHKYVVQDGERLYLDQHKYLAQLSAKAEAIQDVLSGIAHAIGGDHTTDLARLLRIPGSLNRKDQRNGKVPIPTEIIECAPARRYPVSVFEPWKVESESVQRRWKLEKMPLPKIRKLTHTAESRLADLIATSAIAPSGRRW